MKGSIDVEVNVCAVQHLLESATMQPFRVCSAKNSVSMTTEIQRVHFASVIELAMAQASSINISKATNDANYLKHTSEK